MIIYICEISGGHATAQRASFSFKNHRKNKMCATCLMWPSQQCSASFLHGICERESNCCLDRTVARFCSERPLMINDKAALGRLLVFRVGQNRIHTPHMILYLVISLPNIPYIHRILMVSANPTGVLKCSNAANVHVLTYTTLAPCSPMYQLAQVPHRSNTVPTFS
jgi:hypothetical protein